MISDATIREIANMDLSSYVSPESLFQQVQNDIDEFFKNCEIINQVVPAYRNIKEFGVTNTIYETYKDLLWEKLEFDLTPFINCSNEQMVCGIEGLGAVIRKIYEVLRNIIWRLKDFFTLESIFATWLNPCLRLKDRIEKIQQLMNVNCATFNSDTFSATILGTFDYKDFSARVEALTRLIANFSNTLGAEKMTNRAYIEQQIVNNGDVKTLRIKLSSGGSHAELDGVRLIRMDKLFNLHWKADVLSYQGFNVVRLCKNSIDLKSKMNMVERMLTMSERNIADVITGKKEPQVVRDQDTVKALNMLLSLMNIVYNQIRGVANHWCMIGNAYLRSCSSYKPGLFQN